MSTFLNDQSWVRVLIVDVMRVMGHQGGQLSAIPLFAIAINTGERI